MNVILILNSTTMAKYKRAEKQQVNPKITKILFSKYDN